MRVRAVSLAVMLMFAIGYATDVASPWLGRHRPHTCSCPIKGPCCKGDVCPMEVAREHAGGPSFRSCGGPSTPVAVPIFFRVAALLTESITATMLDPAEMQFVAPAPHDSTAVVRVPERPPRALPATA